MYIWSRTTSFGMMNLEKYKAQSCFAPYTWQFRKLRHCPPVPSGVLGMLWLLATVHPDLYTKAECADYAASFYKTFYGFDMDKSIITG